MPCMHCAPRVQAWTYFWKMCVHLDTTAKTRHTVAATVHGEPNFVGFCTNTKGVLGAVWCVFTFKFVFTKSAPDFSVKNYVWPMFASTKVCRMFAENLFTMWEECTMCEWCSIRTGCGCVYRPLHNLVLFL